MTFSIAARCARTGMFGVAISSSSPAVAARCAYARAGVGAACSQSSTDPRLGPRLLDLMATGVTPTAAIDVVRIENGLLPFRQLSVVDAEGHTQSYSGSETLGLHDSARASDCVAAGNLLSTRDVPTAMVDAFTHNPESHLGDRLMAALTAGLAAGGEAGPVHSAGLLVVDTVSWPIVDLRIDWADDPIGDLARLWRLWRPQIDAYITRALDPEAAPGFGVPGG